MKINYTLALTLIIIFLYTTPANIQELAVTIRENVHDVDNIRPLFEAINPQKGLTEKQKHFYAASNLEEEKQKQLVGTLAEKYLVCEPTLQHQHDYETSHIAISPDEKRIIIVDNSDKRKIIAYDNLLAIDILHNNYHMDLPGIGYILDHALSLDVSGLKTTVKFSSDEKYLLISSKDSQFPHDRDDYYILSSGKDTFFPSDSDAAYKALQKPAVLDKKVSFARGKDCIRIIDTATNNTIRELPNPNTHMNVDVSIGGSGESSLVILADKTYSQCLDENGKRLTYRPKFYFGESPSTYFYPFAQIPKERIEDCGLSLKQVVALMACKMIKEKNIVSKLYAKWSVGSHLTEELKTIPNDNIFYRLAQSHLQ